MPDQWRLHYLPMYAMCKAESGLKLTLVVDSTKLQRLRLLSSDSGTCSLFQIRVRRAEPHQFEILTRVASCIEVSGTLSLCHIGLLHT